MISIVLLCSDDSLDFIIFLKEYFLAECGFDLNNESRLTPCLRIMIATIDARRLSFAEMKIAGGTEGSGMLEFIINDKV